jgi:hypothetical protein
MTVLAFRRITACAALLLVLVGAFALTRSGSTTSHTGRSVVVRADGTTPAPTTTPTPAPTTDPNNTIWD